MSSSNTSSSNTGDPRAEAQNALKQAANAARRNDLKEAERWSKVAHALTENAERLAKLPPPHPSIEEEEAMRAELCERLQRFCDQDIALRVWEFEAHVHRVYGERAAREGLPPAPPLRDPPFAKDSVWAHIAKDDEYHRSPAAMLARAIERQTIDYVRERLLAEAADRRHLAGNRDAQTSCD